MLKRWLVFIIVQCLLLAGIGAVIYSHKDRVQIIKTPPASLAQWYKPQNKRQVWLHNMFKLRREMQAVKYYAAQGDAIHLNEWLAQLTQHYLKIGEMVPEWDKKLKPDIIATLQKSADNKHFEQILGQLEQLSDNCQSCHEDYRSITATMYRAADFSTLKLNNNVDFNDHMKQLNKQVNSIKIAATDGFKEVALSSLKDLNLGMIALGEVCSTCHKSSPKEFPDVQMTQTLEKLQMALESGTLKEQGQQLGTLAVQACATCHATHRISFDNREMFTNKRPWAKIIKH